MSEKHLKKGSEFPKNEEGKIRVYSMKICPYAQRVRLLLLIKNIPSEIINIDVFEKPEWIFELNPKGKIPILENGTTFLSESLQICDYLDEKFPQPPLYSKNEEERAKDKALMIDFDNLLEFFYQVLKQGDVTYLEELIKHVDKFENELEKRGLYFGGNEPSMVDYMLWPWAERAPLLTMTFGEVVPDVKSFPHLHSWCEAMRSLEVVQKVRSNIKNEHKIYEMFRNGDTEIDFDMY